MARTTAGLHFFVRTSQITCIINGQGGAVQQGFSCATEE